MSAVSIPTPRMRASTRTMVWAPVSGCCSSCSRRAASISRIWVQNKAQARHVAPQLGPGIGREGRPFRKSQSTQALRRLAQGGLKAPNAEPSQSALDPIDQAGALPNQALALTGWTLGILLFERRDLGHAAVALLAAEPAQEGPLQQRGIQPICFGPPVLARDSDAGWVDHMGFDAVSAQPAGQPEAIATGLKGEGDARDWVACLGGLLLPTPQEAQQRSLVRLDLFKRVSLDPGNEPSDEPS